MANLEQTTQALRNEAQQNEDSLNKTICPLRVENSISGTLSSTSPLALLTGLRYSCPSDERIANHEQTIQALRNEAQQNEDSLNKTICSLRVENSVSGTLS